MTRIDEAINNRAVKAKINVKSWLQQSKHVLMSALPDYDPNKHEFVVEINAEDKTAWVFAVNRRTETMNIELLKQIAASETVTLTQDNRPELAVLAAAGLVVTEEDKHGLVKAVITVGGKEYLKALEIAGDGPYTSLDQVQADMQAATNTFMNAFDAISQTYKDALARIGDRVDQSETIDKRSAKMIVASIGMSAAKNMTKKGF